MKIQTRPRFTSMEVIWRSLLLPCRVVVILSDCSSFSFALPRLGFISGLVMEASSSRSSDSPDQSASKFLSDLPSRGFLSSTVVSSNPGSLRVYVCEHDTSPPEGQHIKTNQQNILIRSLLLKKQKGESSSKGITEDGPKKRAANRALDDRNSAKRAANASRQEGSSSRTGERDLQSLTVEKLRALLKEKGLPTRGRKDELISRLKNAN